MYLLKRVDNEGYSVIKSISVAHELLESGDYVVMSLNHNKFIDKMKFYEEIVNKYKDLLKWQTFKNDY